MNQLELGIPPATYKVVTVFCRAPSEEWGTMWIEMIPVPISYTNSDIAIAATEACALAWEYPVTDVICTGIAEGNVNILDWCDNTDGIV
jgi:hypothetical protein